MQKEKSIQKKKVEKSPAERFFITVDRMLAEATGVKTETSDYQKRLIQSYFVMIDEALKTAESKRNEARNEIPYIWNNVDMEDLALQIKDNSKLGLDPAIPNHLSAIPRLNRHTGKYVIGLMQGYTGKEFIAKKYAAEPILSLTIELVRDTDTFKVLKKNSERQHDDYIFEVNEPFKRGKVIGGFGYIEYEDERKNKLVVMNLSDMDKRKPEYAESSKFWKGWTDEMYYKTLVRFVCHSRNIPQDPLKIEEAINRQKVKELQFARLEAESNVEAALDAAELIGFKDIGGDDEIEEPEIEEPKKLPQNKKNPEIIEIHDAASPPPAEQPEEIEELPFEVEPKPKKSAKKAEKKVVEPSLDWIDDSDDRSEIEKWIMQGAEDR